MKKQAHKVLGIEKQGNAGNLAKVVDPVGTVQREELVWANLSAPQQALLEGHAKRRLGQASPS